MPATTPRPLALVLLGTAALAACSDDSSGVTDPAATYATLTVDASTAPAYVALGATATTTPVTTPATSTVWDLAFTGTPTVAVNGGASGPAGVKAYCLCANSALSLAQVEALTAAQGASAFGAVTTANVPTDTTFVSDASSQAISGWYDYNTTTRAITPNGTAWGVRLASTAGAYAKFHVSAIQNPTQAAAGTVTLEWAVQPSANGTIGADRQLAVDLSGGAKVYVNLTAGTTSNSPSAAWDVALQGYTVTVNGGSNGSGNVGAVPLVPSTFYPSYAAITTIPVGAQGIPAAAFTTDGAGGAFLAAPPYRYDPTSHQVYPTYDVYLVKRGAAVYKVQVVSYYSTGGTFGVLTLRYAKLAG